MASPPDSVSDDGARIEDIDIDISPSFSQMPEEGLNIKNVQNGDDCVENTVKENGHALGSEGEEGEEEKEGEREKEKKEDEKVVNGEEEEKGTMLKMGKEEEEEERKVGREEEEEEEKVKSDEEEDGERVKKKEEKEEEEEENMNLGKQELEEKTVDKEKEGGKEDKIENEKKEEKETVEKEEDEKMKKEEKEEEETVKKEGEKKEGRAKKGEEEDEEEEDDDDTSDTTGEEEEEEEEEVDPRVAENLEVMNHSCAEVNRLENELDEARCKYRSTFQTSSQKMEELGGKMKKTIQRARLYYDLIGKARQAQSEALLAARLYQSANGTYRAAVEMVTLAEKGLVDDAADNASTSKTAATTTLSSAWQEHLNHAIERVSEAEREKTHTEADHNKKAAICAQLEGRLKFLEKKYKRSIAKARPYFETKAELELKLQQLKQNIVDLQQAIGARKARYSEAMRCLEAVSTEIHESRRTRHTRKNLLLQYPREPGVGAETDSLGSGISEPNIERSMFSTSTLNLHNDEDDDDEDYDESDDVGNLSDADSITSSGSTAPRRHVSRSLSRRLTPKPHALTSQGHPSEGVFSRSVSSCSVFSSEGHSDTASEPPGSPRLPVHHKSPTEKHLLSSSSSLSGSAPSLMDVVRGDLNHPLLRNNVAEKQPSSDVAAVSGDKSVAKGVSSSSVAQGSSEAEEGFISEFCERGAGDGSAQDDCCPTEPQLQVSPQDCSQNSSSGLDPAPASLLHSAQGGVSPPQGNPQSAASSQDKGEPEAVKSASSLSGGGCAVKKAPLRRTDAPVHRPLQGVMLLNPSDLAQTSFHYAPRR